jgi:tRNA (uracil-5-)-methyltransferase
MPLSRVHPQHYGDLLQQKVDTVCELLAPLSPPEPRVFPSPPEGFRLRAEFRIWHEGDDLNYVMFRREDPRTPVVITHFPIATENIQRVMSILREKLEPNDTLRRKLFQVEFLATLTGEMIVTLIYHRKLDECWEGAAQMLATELQETAPSISIIGRSRKQKIVIGKDYVQEILSIHGRDYRYRQYEQAFSQPNGQVNTHMIEWACEQASDLSGDLLELYCGNGNFTIPLSRHFGSVIATEVSKASIRAARANLQENDIDNVQLVRMSTEEVIQALNQERTFRRISELPKPLDHHDLDTLFIDPPRSGLDEHTVAMASRFPSIIYISCNPHSLAENLRSLHQSHAIKHFALFDQFPYTDHMECGVLLQHR